MDTFYSTVTQKGQVTIPVSLRRAFNIKPYSRVEFSRHKEHIAIEKVVDLLDLAGTIKAKKGMDALKARDYMETHYKRT